MTPKEVIQLVEWLAPLAINAGEAIASAFEANDAALARRRLVDAIDTQRFEEAIQRDRDRRRAARND